MIRKAFSLLEPSTPMLELFNKPTKHVPMVEKLEVPILLAPAGKIAHRRQSMVPPDAPQGTTNGLPKESTTKGFGSSNLLVGIANSVSQSNGVSNAAANPTSIGSPSVPPVLPKYDPKIEDAQMRDVIWAQYFLDHLEYVFRLGLSPFQCAVWISVIKRTHSDFITYAKKQPRKKMDHAICLGIFKDLIFDAQMSKGYVFSLNEMKQLIDFFMDTYGRHVRLMALVFAHPQEVVLSKFKKSIEWQSITTAFSISRLLPPLSTAIPAEKWDEYCKSEEEKARLDKQAVLESMERERLVAEQEAKSKADAETSAALAEQQYAAERALVDPFPEFQEDQYRIVHPVVEDVFRKPTVAFLQKTLDPDARPTTPQIQVIEPEDSIKFVKKTDKPGKNIRQSDSKAILKDDLKGSRTELDEKEKPSTAGRKRAATINLRRPTSGSLFNLAPVIDPTSTYAAISKVSEFSSQTEPIPKSTKLSRGDISLLLSSGPISKALSEMSEKLTSKLTFQNSEFMNRIERLESAIAAREDDKNPKESFNLVPSGSINLLKSKLAPDTRDSVNVMKAPKARASVMKK